MAKKSIFTYLTLLLQFLVLQFLVNKKKSKNKQKKERKKFQIALWSYSYFLLVYISLMPQYRIKTYSSPVRQCVCPRPPYKQRVGCDALICLHILRYVFKILDPKYFEYISRFSSVSIVDFNQINVSWEDYVDNKVYHSIFQKNISSSLSLSSSLRNFH